MINRLNRKNSVLEDQLEKLDTSLGTKIEIIKRLKREKGEWLQEKTGLEAQVAELQNRLNNRDIDPEDEADDPELDETDDPELDETEDEKPVPRDTRFNGIDG